MKGTATVFAAVYAAVVSRQVVEVPEEGGAARVVSVSWESRRARAELEATRAADSYIRTYTNNE